MNTVSASGATSLRLAALWTMPLASSRPSDYDFHRSLERPAPPEVALRAASQSTKQPSAPISGRDQRRQRVDDREIDQALRLAGAENG